MAGHANIGSSSQTMGYTVVGSCRMRQVRGISYQWYQRVQRSMRQWQRQQWQGVSYRGLFLTRTVPLAVQLTRLDINMFILQFTI
jgi:hypothetical protein